MFLKKLFDLSFSHRFLDTGQNSQMNLFNQFMLSGLFHINYLDKYISNIRSVWLVSLLPCFIAVPVLNADRVDPDQTPHSVAFDLGLFCL